MAWFTDFSKAAIGKKAVMAVSGIILFGFVLVHMIGNLHLYEGPGHLDEYGQFLRHMGAPALPPNGALWIARLVLLSAVVLHIWSAWQVTLMNRAARPTDYTYRPQVHTTYAARTMRWGGAIILLFVIYHLLHFTTGTVHPSFEEGAVYHNVVAGFSVWWVSLFYIVAQLALGLHLYHGVWSLFQSLGWSHPRFNLWRNGLAQAFAWIVTLGNISFPIAVLTGLVR
ncbi:MAG TPA: succinate dehydrogenase [Acidobacteria bacterium]|nr:succinate dehydrogenase [Acidobacteriota bacterium]